MDGLPGAGPPPALRAAEPWAEATAGADDPAGPAGAETEPGSDTAPAAAPVAGEVGVTACLPADTAELAVDEAEPTTLETEGVETETEEVEAETEGVETETEGVETEAEGVETETEGVETETEGLETEVVEGVGTDGSPEAMPEDAAMPRAARTSAVRTPTRTNHDFPRPIRGILIPL